MTEPKPHILNQASPITIGLAAVFSGGVFAAGILFAQVQAIDKMELPTRLALIQADLYVIKRQLGIPTPSHQAVTSPETSSLRDATARRLIRPQSISRRTVASPE